MRFFPSSYNCVVSKDENSENATCTGGSTKSNMTNLEYTKEESWKYQCTFFNKDNKLQAIHHRMEAIKNYIGSTSALFVADSIETNQLLIHPHIS